MIEEFDWSELHLAEPFWLILLLMIPFLAWLHSKGKVRKPSIQYPSLAKILQTKSFGPKHFHRLPRILRSFSIILVVLALSRPQLDQSTETIRSSGVDIVLAIDLSASMLALDMSEDGKGEVTRLDVVKEVIKEFIDKRNHDRLGLVAFSVNPYLVSADSGQRISSSKFGSTKGGIDSSNRNQHWFGSSGRHQPLRSPRIQIKDTYSAYGWKRRTDTTTQSLDLRRRRPKGQY